MRSERASATRRVAVAAGGLAALIGGAHVVAWLGGLMPRGPTSAIVMKTNAGLGFLASGLALILIAGRSQGPRRTRIAQFSAAVALLLGLATLSEHVVGWNLGIDQLLATELAGAPATASPNRMGPPASLSLVLLGTALLSLIRRTGAGRRRPVHEPLALAAGLLGLLSIIGYLYGVSALYQIARLTGIAWPTALSVLLLAVGVLCAEPDRGLMGCVTASDPGGAIVRALLGPTVLLPLVLGWIRLMGEHLGWFDAAMGTGLMMLLFIVTFSSLLVFAGRRVSVASAAVRTGEARLRLALAAARMVAWEYDPASRQLTISENADDVLALPRGDGLKDSDRGYSLIHPGDVERHRTLVTEAIEKAGSYVSVYRQVRDGEVFWLEERGRAVTDASGRTGRLVGVTHDITARKRAEEELRQSEQRLALAASATGIGIFVSNSLTGDILATEQFGYLVGLRATTTTTTTTATLSQHYHNDQWAERVHPDDWPALQAAIDACQSERRPLDAEYRVAGHDGTERWVNVRGVFEDDEQGNATRCLGVLLDITDRKRAEEALRTATRRFQTIVDHAPLAIYVKDRDGRFVFGNQRLQRYTGRPLEALLGKTDYDFAPKEDADRWRLNDLRVMAGEGASEFEETGADAEGRAFVNISNKFPLTDESGTPVEMCGIATDITERKKAEAEHAADLAALVRMHALSRQGVEAGSIEALLQETMDTAVAITQADKGTLQLLEGDALRIVAQHGHEQPFLDHFAAAENTASVCGEATRRGERVIVPDVETSPIFIGTPSLPVMRAAGVRAVQSTPLLTRGGRLLGILTTQWAAPHKPGEHDLWRLDLLARQAADLIEQRQGDRELREANADLSETDRRKDEFIAILSHELRNPLAPIRYALPALQKAGVTEAGGEALHVIERQVAHLTRLVDDLLDVSRITSGRIELRREHVTLRSVVRAAVEAAAPAIAVGGHSLTINIPDEPLWVYGDAARLSQVVTNLLDNSAKYTPRGGQLHVTVSSEGGRAAISVRDNGVGIPADELPTVFEMFHQVNRAEKAQAGLGIGLALVKRLVDMHGGTVEAHSAGVGQGAEFVVRLSVAADVEAESAGVAPVSAAPRRLRVLVVDDNADLVAMLAVFVESFGHDVRKAFDGPSAMSAAVSYRPDVVLLDLGLPGMTGLDVARELRRRPETRGARLIALTGWGQADDRQATESAGFDAHLTKPTDPDALEAMLNCERRSCADCVDSCAAAARLPHPGTAR